MRFLHLSRLPHAAALAACALSLAAFSTASSAAPKKSYGVARKFGAGMGAPAGLDAAMKKVAVPAPSLKTPLAKKPKVSLVTSRGTILLELDATAAPLTVRSFVYLVQRGFYNGTAFHRYADLTGQGGNIIQGGDPFTRSPKTRTYAGLGGPGYTVPLEISKLKHQKLSIAMARSSDPDSGGSQFYICQGQVSFLDGQYAVFGKVISGQKAALSLRQDDVIKSAKLVK